MMARPTLVPRALSKLIVVLVAVPATAACLVLWHALSSHSAVVVGRSAAAVQSQEPNHAIAEPPMPNLVGVYIPALFDGCYNRVWSTDTTEDALDGIKAWPSVTKLSSRLTDVLSRRLPKETSGTLCYDQSENQWTIKTDLSEGDGISKFLVVDSSLSSEERSKKCAEVACVEGLVIQSFDTKYRNNGRNSNIRSQTFLGGTEDKVSSQPGDSPMNTFRRNPNKVAGAPSSSGEKHPVVSQLTNYPATTLIMAINIGLFLWYWNHDASVTAVALNSQVWIDYGRSFSGSLAHFDAMHIGFNMMAMSSLGQMLEPRFGSISFFLWNVSLIPIVTLILLGLKGLHRYYLKRQGQTISEDFGNIVGFSGVLFAWLVVSALTSQSQMCPIPLLPDLCFGTYYIGNIPLHIGPIVQLVVAQVLLPRSCFVGHLAGIIAGFLLHWGLLSLEWLQPCIIFPALWFYGKLLDAPNGNASAHASSFIPRIAPRPEEPQANGAVDNPALQAHRRQQRNKLAPARRAAAITQAMMALVLVQSQIYFAWGVASSLLWSQILGFISFRALVQALSSDGMVPSTRIGVVGRGCVIIFVVLIISDSMTLGGWWATRGLWQNGGFFSSVWIPLTLWTLRSAINFCALCLASHQLILHNEVLTTGIFVHVFGPTIIQPAQMVGSVMCAAEARICCFRRPWRILSAGDMDDDDDDDESGETASLLFPGQGARLGTAARLSPNRTWR